MPSEECFVYITLPGQTEPVTAGRYQLDTSRQGTAVGQFVYGRSYLSRSDRVEFDPVELKLQVPVFRTTKLRGNFGALRDSSPDSWGRKLIEKRLGNVSPTEMEYLLNSPDDRAGALGFGLNVRRLLRASSTGRSTSQSSSSSPTKWSRRRRILKLPSLLGPMRRRPKRCFVRERRWAAHVRRPPSRTTMRSGSQNSRIGTTDGTIHAWNTRCWRLRAIAEFRPRKAG